MAQVRIYGYREHLETYRDELSELVHSALVTELGIPQEKRFQRFLPLADADFVHPGDRSERYTIVEVVLFSGRRVATKKAAIRAMFARAAELGMAAADLEIVFLEAPAHDWGIRGRPADELMLDYRVDT